MAVPETSTHIIYNIIQRHRQLLAVILYRYLYLYILYYIIYRAPGVANGNNHFLLRAAVHSGQQGTEGRERLAGWNADWLLRYITQGVNAIGCHHATAAAKLKCFNSSVVSRYEILVKAPACTRAFRLRHMSKLVGFF